MCEGNGCGSVDMSDVLPGETITNDMNSADYCCSSAFEDPDIAVCAVDGGEAPCIILGVSCFLFGSSTRLFACCVIDVFALFCCSDLSVGDWLVG